MSGLIISFINNNINYSNNIYYNLILLFNNSILLSNLWYIFNTIHISVIKLLAHRRRQIVSCIWFRILWRWILYRNNDNQYKSDSINQSYIGYSILLASHNYLIWIIIIHTRHYVGCRLMLFFKLIRRNGWSDHQ